MVKSVCAFVIGVGKMFSDFGAEVRVPQLKLNGFVRYVLKLTMQIRGVGAQRIGSERAVRKPQLRRLIAVARRSLV